MTKIQNKTKLSRLTPSRIEEIIELVNKIEKADNLISSESKTQKDQKLQILPGNQTGVLSSLR